MVWVKRRLSFLVLLVVPLLATGCAPPPAPSTFNDKICEFNEKLFKIGLGFRVALIPWLYPEEIKGLEGNGMKVEAEDFEREKVREKVGRSQANADTALKEVREDFKKMGMPRDSETGRQMSKAYEAFLVVEETIVKENMKEIIKILDDSDLSEDAKKEAVKAELAKIEKAELEVGKDLVEAQKAFATAHNLAPMGGAMLRPPEKDKDKPKTKDK